TAHDVARGPRVDRDAVPGIPKLGIAGDVGPDVVALDQVARGAGSGDQDAAGESAGLAVAADEIAGAGCRAADRIATRPARHEHAIESIADSRRAAGARADVVGLNPRASETASRKDDAAPVVSTNYISYTRRPGSFPGSPD